MDMLILLLKPFFFFCLLYLDNIDLALLIEKLGFVLRIQPLHLLAEALIAQFEQIQLLFIGL